MKKKSFAMGFWNYCSAGDYGLEEPETWKNMGTTITMSHEFFAGKDSKQEFLRFLDKCQDQGIKIVVCDSRTSWREHKNRNFVDYEKDVKSAVADFGNHPAVFGFSVGDEPGDDDFEIATKGCQFCLKYAPNLQPFVNFFQYNPNTERKHLNGKNFKTWMDKFIKLSKLRVICYDEYRQLDNTEEGLNEYFENLKIFQEISEKNKCDWWITPSLVGHWDRRIPNHFDLQWQFNTAVAAGAKGVIWFFLYQREPHVNFEGAPIDEYGHKRENFYELARLQKNFFNTYGNLFANFKLIKYCHAKEKYYGYGGVKKFVENEDNFVKDIKSKNSTPISYSIFNDAENNTYLAFVNLSQTKSDYFTLTFNDSIKKLEQLMFNNRLKDLQFSHQDDHFIKKSNIEYSTWMSPGQMNVYKISKKVE